MSVASASEIRSAATIAEDRLVLANKVKSLRDEMIAGSDEIRSEKSGELQSTIDQLEACDGQYQLVKALENANAMVEKYSQQPQRPQATSKAAVIDRQSGQLVSGGELATLSEAEVMGSYDYHKAFESFLGARGKLEDVKSRNHRDVLERYGKGGDRTLSPNEIFAPFRKDMYLASTSLGSNVVAPDFRFDVITPRTVQPVMPRICQMLSTTVSSVTIPKNNDANTDTRYGTTFRPTKGESPNGTVNQKDTGPFGQMIIYANTGSMFADVSRDFFQDAPNLSSYLQGEASKAFAAIVDDEVINGVTANTQAEGILTNTSIGITKTGTANTLVAAKMTEAYYAFRQQYSPNLSWVMARGTHGKLLQLLDTTGRQLFLPNSLAGYTQSPQPDILGSPVYFNEFVPASGASSAKSILVGNFSEYFLLMRQGFTVLVDDISMAYKNRIRVSFSYRFGGAVRDPKAFQIVHEAV